MVDHGGIEKKLNKVRVRIKPKPSRMMANKHNKVVLLGLLIELVVDHGGITLVLALVQVGIIRNQRDPGETDKRVSQSQHKIDSLIPGYKIKMKKNKILIKKKHNNKKDHGGISSKAHLVPP